MFSIEMGGYDISLGDEWVRTAHPMTMNLLVLYMSFQENGDSYILKGFKETNIEIIN